MIAEVRDFIKDLSVERGKTILISSHILSEIQLLADDIGIIALVARMKKGYWLALVFAEIYSFAGLFANMSNIWKIFYTITAVFNLSGYYKVAAGKLLAGEQFWCHYAINAINLGVKFFHILLLSEGFHI